MTCNPHQILLGWSNRRRMSWVGCAYTVLLGKCEGKEALGRCKHRFEDDMKMDLKVMGLVGCVLDWPGSGHGQMTGSCVNMVMNLQVL